MLYLNGAPVEVTRFPDLTSQVWKLPESTFLSNKAAVLWEFSNEAEVMHLFQLQHLLDTRDIRTTLTIKYLPYARQDKEVSNTSTFALKTFLKIFRTFNFHKVIIMDPHNFDAVRPGCQMEAVYPDDAMVDVMNLVKPDLFCYPDKGALNKYSKIYIEPYVYGEKDRDQLTGNIKSYKLVGEVYDKNVLIVDDICDGGMTFKLLARDLLAAGAKEVNLFVTHGIFSKGLRTLNDSGIKKIFTQDGEAYEYQNQIMYRRLS